MSDELLVAESGANEAGGLSQVERVVDTFVAPVKAFTDILRSTTWWLPLVLSAIPSYILVAAISMKVGWSQLVDNTIMTTPGLQARLAGLDPAQVATQHKVLEYSYKIPLMVGPVLGIIILLIMSVVLWAVINFVFGGKATYGQVFCLGNYAFLPAGIKSLIAAIVLFAGGGENFTLQNLLGTSPGYYIETPGALKTFLTSFDLFTLWSVVLLSLGLAIVAKTKRSSGFITVGGLWFLFVLLGTAGAAFSS